MLRILLAALAVVLFGFVGACVTTGVGAAGNTSDGMGVSDIRFTQAKILWDRGFTRQMQFKTMDDYLGTIPLVPEFSPEVEQRFPLLVLVDGRVNSYCACSLILEHCYGMDADIPFGCGDGPPRIIRPEPNIDRYPGDNDPKVYWIRVQASRKNQGLSPKDAVKLFAADEVPLTAREGIATYIQHPEVVEGYHMFLPGSDHVCYKEHHVLQLGKLKDKLSLDHAPPDVENGVFMTFRTPSRAK